MGIAFAILPWLAPELSAGLGAYAGPTDILIPLRIGVRFEIPLHGSVKPFLGLAFAHNHETALEHVLMDPLPAIFGLSEHGVHHRSGFEVGVGVSWEFWRFARGRFGARWQTRLNFSQMFGVGPPRYLELATGVALAF